PAEGLIGGVPQQLAEAGKVADPVAAQVPFPDAFHRAAAQQLEALLLLAREAARRSAQHGELFRQARQVAQDDGHDFALPRSRISSPRVGSSWVSRSRFAMYADAPAFSAARRW